MGEQFRIFATTDIGGEALDRLREKGWEVEVYDHLPAPPKKLLLEKVRSGIDALITTLRDKIDKGFGKKLIHTIRGVGYVLKENT